MKHEQERAQLICRMLMGGNASARAQAVEAVERACEAEAELQAAQEREKMAYAVILNALDPHRGGYRATALDRLRRFARGRSGLTDDEAAALAPQRTEELSDG